MFHSNNIIASLILFLICISLSGQENKSAFRDLNHFSQVFNREKEYRIYLPINYHLSDKRYPVIYHFHGWGGRHFKDGSANLEYELIGELVNKYQIILVMWDGNMIESEPRPYNIGYHEDMIFEQQMKDYFLELITHIDNSFKTKTDRNSRGIIGFSMGGMMAFYLSGKYPDKVSAAVNMVGSTEFYIGTPDNYTFYPLRYTFSNLSDVQIRLHNSTLGELTDLNIETHHGALWEGIKKYEYFEVEGGHGIDIPEKTDVYEKAMKFISTAFNKPIPVNEKWSHYDLYDNFEIWDYTIESDKKQPGFILLQNVSHSGFGFYTKKWLPKGPNLSNFQTTITTAPIYEPDTEYRIVDYNQKRKIQSKKVLKSDSLGRLQFKLNTDGHEIGIYVENGSPKLTFIDYNFGEGQKMLHSGKENELNLKVANLGKSIESGKIVDININSNDKDVFFEPSSLVGVIDKDGSLTIPPLLVNCSKKPTKDARPADIKISLKLTYDKLNYNGEFSVPVFFKVNAFTQISIDDGKLVRDKVLGVGNGDGEVSPGEEIMIYTNGHRTQLFYDDPFIIQEKLFDEALPAVWQEDGITFSSIIKISENCPDKHKINLLAKYETKTYNPITRRVHWGKIEINITKKRL